MERCFGYARVLSTAAPVPNATVTVYNAGTLDLATIYSDNLSTPTAKSNPFTADSDGYFFFYGAGRFDVRFTHASLIDSPYTWGDISLSFTAEHSIRDFGAVGDGTTDDTTAITNAISAAVGGQIYVPPGTYRITSNLTIPLTVGVHFATGGKFTVDSGDTLTINGPIDAPDAPIFAGAGNYVLPNAGNLHVRWFGAKGDASTDDSAAIQKTYDTAAASRNCNVYFGAGIFCYGTQIELTNASNAGVTFIGIQDEAHQQGSILPATVLRWTGGAEATIVMSETFCTFKNFAIENFGTATCFLEVTQDGAGRVHFKRISATRGAGTANYSTAIVSMTYSNYDYFEDCEIASCAPVFVLMSSDGSHGTTTLHFNNNIIDCNANTPSGMKVLELINVDVELLIIENNTFNNQNGGGGLIVVDSRDIGASNFLINCIYKNNEYDGDASMGDIRVMYLTNCKNAVVEGCTFFGGSGAMTALFDIENTYMHIGAINASSVNGYVVDTTDALSKVFTTNAFLDVANCRGLVNPSTSSGIADVSISGSTVFILGHHGNPGGHTVFLYDADDSTSRDIVVPDYSSGSPGPSYVVRGQIITIMVKNTSGGAMGTTTFNSSYFKLGAAWTDPADGFSRSITFVHDGTRFVEIGRTPADVTNP